MGDTSGVCYNCLNGFHKGCDNKNCTCKKSKHITWWWKEMGMQNDISRWANDVFGKPVSNIQIASRANEEMAELLNTLSMNDKSIEAIEECADIVICLYRLASELEESLNDAIDKKMKKNINRKWNTKGNGIGYHKK